MELEPDTTVRFSTGEANSELAERGEESSEEQSGERIGGKETVEEISSIEEGLGSISSDISTGISCDVLTVAIIVVDDSSDVSSGIAKDVVSNAFVNSSTDTPVDNSREEDVDDFLPHLSVGTLMISRLMKDFISRRSFWLDFGFFFASRREL